MAQYKPAAPFSTALILLIPSYKTVSGVQTKEFPKLSDGVLFYCSFKTYGGTERDVNGIYSIEDTASVECWYRPDIASECRVAIPDTGAMYEIFGVPENIDMRNQYLQFKVRRVKGGV